MKFIGSWWPSPPLLQWFFAVVGTPALYVGAGVVALLALGLTVPSRLPRQPPSRPGHPLRQCRRQPRFRRRARRKPASPSSPTTSRKTSARSPTCRGTLNHEKNVLGHHRAHARGDHRRLRARRGGESNANPNDATLKQVVADQLDKVEEARQAVDTQKEAVATHQDAVDAAREAIAAAGSRDQVAAEQGSLRRRQGKGRCLAPRRRQCPRDHQGHLRPLVEASARTSTRSTRSSSRPKARLDDAKGSDSDLQAGRNQGEAPAGQHRRLAEAAQGWHRRHRRRHHRHHRAVKAQASPARSARAEGISWPQGAGALALPLRAEAPEADSTCGRFRTLLSLNPRTTTGAFP